MEINKIYNENCLETMARMPDGFIDLVVTSPPYDNLRKYNGYSFDFEAIAAELFRVVKVGGVVVWVVADATVNGSETGTSFRQALHFMSLGFNLHDTMIYASAKPPLTHNRYEQEFEYMFVFAKGKPNAFNPKMEDTVFGGGNKYRMDGKKRGAKKDAKSAIRYRDQKTVVSAMKICGNIWEYPTGQGGSTSDSAAFDHPAIFPEKLAKDHILSWSNEGDLVYDCFGGSGTTAKMSHLEKRNWIISEISSEYAELAAKRIDPYLRQMTLF